MNKQDSDAIDLLEIATHLSYFGYQVMPVDDLFGVQQVRLVQPVQAIIGTAGQRVNCDLCGEEIINQRETAVGHQVFCQTCIGQGYYVPKVEL